MSAPFRYRQRVRYHECDPQGVVFNSHYLAYFDVALTELWREAGGYDEMIGDGTDMVVAEARVRYLAPLAFDDEFDVAIEIIRLGETSMGSSFVIERAGEATTEGDGPGVLSELTAIYTAKSDRSPFSAGVDAGAAATTEPTAR